MDQSWKREKGPRKYKVRIERWTHTKFQRPVRQEREEVIVEAPDHRPRLAAIKAGCPKTAKTMTTGWYTTEIEFYNLPPDQNVRNWTAWHVQPVFGKGLLS